MGSLQGRERCGTRSCTQLFQVKSNLIPRRSPSTPHLILTTDDSHMITCCADEQVPTLLTPIARLRSCSTTGMLSSFPVSCRLFFAFRVWLRLSIGQLRNCCCGPRSIIQYGQASTATLVANSPVQTSAAELVATYLKVVKGEANAQPMLPLSFATVNGVRTQQWHDPIEPEGVDATSPDAPLALSFADSQRNCLCPPCRAHCVVTT